MKTTAFMIITTIGLLMTVFTNCSAPLGTAAQFTPVSLAVSPQSLALSVTPNPASVVANSFVQLTASGGTQPYTFVAASAGGCAVTRNSGLVQSPNVAGTCVITVTDGAGSVVQASVVVTSGTTTISYAWSQTTYGTCTASCGGGVQTAAVWCATNNGVMVDDSYCAGTTKPAVIQACNAQACSNTSGIGKWANVTGVTASLSCTSSYGFVINAVNSDGTFTFTIPLTCGVVGTYCQVNNGAMAATNQVYQCQ